MISVIIIISSAIFAAVLLCRSRWERGQLRTESCCIVNKYAPQGGLRIAFISDVHDRLTEKGINEISAAVRREGAELIILGGDIITFRKGDKKLDGTGLVTELIKMLSAAGPVFYAEGNHELKARLKLPREYEAFTKACSSAGAVIMSDSHEIYKGISFYCAALGSEYYRKMLPGLGRKEAMPDSYLIGKLGTADRNRMNILIMHSPMYLEETARWGADLVLSGHFHGGTIRLPFIGGLMTPQYQFFVRECAGIHKEKQCTMIVSRGIGTHSINLRLNDLPELCIIDIMPQASDGI